MMAGYRICSLDAEGLIRTVTSGAFDNEDEAMAVAADFVRRFPTVEVWNNGRLIRSLRQSAQSPEEASVSTGW